MRKPVVKEHLTRKSVPRDLAKPKEREVHWERDAPGSLPASTRDQLLAFSMECTDTRKQLDILRKTRGQRTLEPLKVPMELRAGILLSDVGDTRRGESARVEKRTQLAAVQPADD